jgi:hypothetical protein
VHAELLRNSHLQQWSHCQLQQHLVRVTNIVVSQVQHHMSHQMYVTALWVNVNYERVIGKSVNERMLENKWDRNAVTICRQSFEGSYA